MSIATSGYLGGTGDPARMINFDASGGVSFTSWKTCTSKVIQSQWKPIS